MKLAVILGIAVIGFSFLFCACCGKKGNEVPQLFIPSVEETIIADRGYMSKEYGEYMWYETSILLKNYLDSEEASDTVIRVSSIFQVIKAVGDGFDTHVIFCDTTPDGRVINVKSAFWVGDSALNGNESFITFDAAYDFLMRSNYPKPHSRQVVLRKELGPVPCNPQYIFGNVMSHLFVDAVTGEVNVENPAYKGFGKSK